jgi:osmotically-inducible protein OsmY
MKKYTIVFVIGIVVGTAGYWVLRESKLVQKVSSEVDERATNRLKEEMEKQGKIVMNKRAGSSIPTVEDSLLSDLVKAKIAAEPMLSNASIKEEVKDGEVSLNGSAASYEQVARALRLALECDATRTVVSTIQVKPK